MAVNMYLEEGLSYRGVCDELDIPDMKTVRMWVKNYHLYGEEGLKERRGQKKCSIQDKPRKQTITLEEQIIRLKAENEYLKKWLNIERS